MYDVIVIGGSYAGLSAALQLARARCSVFIVDSGQRRNRFAAHAHGFLTRDGEDPAAIAARARADVLAYPTVSWRDGSVVDARAAPDGFHVRVGSDELRAKRLILATGVTDTLPAVPGLRERWGKTAFHCPYCHGYELDRGRLGVLASGPLALHLAALVNEWATPGQLTLFLNGAFQPDAEQLAELTSRAVKVEPQPVVECSGDAPVIELRLADGSKQVLKGLFVMPETRVTSSFAEQLGCGLEVGPTGAFYKTDMTKETSVPGVFACGDAGLAFSAISIAVADGTMAGAAAHRSLVFRH